MRDLAKKAQALPGGEGGDLNLSRTSQVAKCPLTDTQLADNIFFVFFFLTARA